ncbi:Fcf1-domain-containing protein [Xylariaceae sp. FL1272]|nr:Fcf1-domain-containing protein [Xylariaceae sp. FL1272]
MPRAKRSKQYRKLMSHYVLNFGFREPYQVICDSQFLEAAVKSKMDIEHIMKATLHGTTKLLITQCSIRHLYARNTEPGIAATIDFAKSLERRRCGHLPSDYPEPLSESECLHSVVDPKQTGVNKHHVCCAINDDDVRSSLRNSVTAVPLLYIRRSVLIMEPASSATVEARSRDEKSKFRAELKTVGGKRKREEDDTDNDEKGLLDHGTASSNPEKKKRKGAKPFGRKEPNSLSMKKKKKENPRPGGGEKSSKAPPVEHANVPEAVEKGDRPITTSSEEVPRKRRRKHKSKSAGKLSEATEDGDGLAQGSAGDD